MGVDIVSTYTMFQNTMNDVGRAQNNLANLQMQLSSGYKSQDFAGMADQAQQFLSLENSIARSTQYMNNNKQVATRINSTALALDQILNTANSLQSLIIQRRTGTAPAATFTTQIEGAWQTFAGQLNSSVDGRFLFSGTKINSAPVDSSQFPEMEVWGEPDDSYYQGSKQSMTARVSDDVQLDYNVRADELAFQKIAAALSITKEANQTGNDLDLGRAYQLLTEGIQGVISLQAKVNSNKVTVSNIDQMHSSMKLYWQGIKEEVGNTDMIAASTQVAVNQGILQASFQAFAKINSLRLSDYLK